MYDTHTSNLLSNEPKWLSNIIVVYFDDFSNLFHLYTFSKYLVLNNKRFKALCLKHRVKLREFKREFKFEQINLTGNFKLTLATRRQLYVGFLVYETRLMRLNQISRLVKVRTFNPSSINQNGTIFRWGCGNIHVKK